MAKQPKPKLIRLIADHPEDIPMIKDAEKAAQKMLETSLALIERESKKRGHVHGNNLFPMALALQLAVARLIDMWTEITTRTGEPITTDTQAVIDSFAANVGTILRNEDLQYTPMHPIKRFKMLT